MIAWISARRFVSTALLCFVGVVTPARGSDRPEIRALWVDAFHEGIRSEAEIDELVAHAKRHHFNTLIVQVRRRADALFASDIEPSLDDPHYDPAFDALAATIRKAHRAGLQVHAWLNAMPAWRDEPPHKDPRHIFNRHGLDAMDSWLTSHRDGSKKYSVGYFLDPGHPAVQEHLVSVYLDVVRRYDVDGIHFDYIRYPETEIVLPRGSDVGYNETALRRFASQKGRNKSRAAPEPGDPEWIQWRRDQVTYIVRRISVEARAIKPRIRVSAATITWGPGPRDEQDYENTSPMQRALQDWRSWLASGFLDVAFPMNYMREHVPAHREWFDQWIRFEKRNRMGRAIASGLGAYLSSKDGVLAQISRVRTRDGRHALDGVSIYSYFRPSGPAGTAPLPAGAVQEMAEPNRFDFLTEGHLSAAAAFTHDATIPAMPWIDAPRQGFIAGELRDKNGVPVDGGIVKIRRTGLFGRTRDVTTDANGYFGLARVQPGRYRLEAVAGSRGTRALLEVRSGEVARVRWETR